MREHLSSTLRNIALITPSCVRPTPGIRTRAPDPRASTRAPAMNPSIALAFCPTGKLRAAINLGNPILPAGRGQRPARRRLGRPARAYAGELGVELELVVVDAAGKSVDIVTQAQADIGFSPSIPCAARASPSPSPMC